MSVRTTLFPGILIRILRIPQGLWYSHSAIPASLKLSLRVVDLVFTSTEGSTSIHSNKLRYTGHGIDYSEFPTVEDVLRIHRSGIVSLGRLVKVKNLDKIISAGRAKSNFPKITFIGPREDDNVLTSELRNLASKEDVELRILPAIPHGEVPEALSKYSFYYSGTPKSVDKATLEAASVGCIIITEERPASELTGMNLGWKKMGYEGHIDLAAQIALMQSLTDGEINNVRKEIMDFTRTNNNVINTTRNIIEQLRELR
jgi:glycosyltransferase involved in cell wall biosynthesis